MGASLTNQDREGTVGALVLGGVQGSLGAEHSIPVCHSLPLFPELPLALSVEVCALRVLSRR